MGQSKKPAGSGGEFDVAWVSLDRDSSIPLGQQLFVGLRDLILSGRVPSSTRLPAGRLIARQLGIARGTVSDAIDRLALDGLVTTRQGAGTYVADVRGLVPSGSRMSEAPDRAGAARLGPLGRRLAEKPSPRARGFRPLEPCVPAVDRFPWELWSRLLAKAWARPSAALVSGPGDGGGYMPLRRAIADHLARHRAVRAEPEQVIIVAGAQQGLDLVARLFLAPGDTVWVEDPGYVAGRQTLTAAGAKLVPVRVDDAGLDVADGVAKAERARLALVTPTHQFPLGVTMSLERRLALLDWARRSDALILEDDFDSDYRYGGRPLAALQGLDRDGRVLYLGTFSRVLFSGIRLGFLVVPPELHTSVLRARRAIDNFAPMTAQPALAAFMEEGHFGRHMRDMRLLYLARQQALLDAVGQHGRGLLSVTPDAGGMHLVADIVAPDLAAMEPTELRNRLAGSGIEAPLLDGYFVGTPDRRGVMLGYTAFDPDVIDAAVRDLCAAMAGTHPNGPMGF